MHNAIGMVLGPDRHVERQEYSQEKAKEQEFLVGDHHHPRDAQSQAEAGHSVAAVVEQHAQRRGCFGPTGLLSVDVVQGLVGSDADCEDDAAALGDDVSQCALRANHQGSNNHKDKASQSDGIRSPFYRNESQHPVG